MSGTKEMRKMAGKITDSITIRICNLDEKERSLLGLLKEASQIINSSSFNNPDDREKLDRYDSLLTDFSSNIGSYIGKYRPYFERFYKSIKEEEKLNWEFGR